MPPPLSTPAANAHEPMNTRLAAAYDGIVTYHYGPAKTDVVEQ